MTDSERVAVLKKEIILLKKLIEIQDRLILKYEDDHPRTISASSCFGEATGYASYKGGCHAIEEG